MFQNNNISPFKFALCNIGRSIRCVVKQCNRVIKWVLSKIYRSFLTLKLSLFLCHFFLLRWLNVCYVATLHVDNTWSIFLFSSLSDKNILETNKLYNFVCNLWEIIFTNSCEVSLANWKWNTVWTKAQIIIADKTKYLGKKRS